MLKPSQCTHTGKLGRSGYLGTLFLLPRLADTFTMADICGRTRPPIFGHEGIE